MVSNSELAQRHYEDTRIEREERAKIVAAAQRGGPLNTSGLVPTEFCVVVEMDPTPEKVGSIFMPSDVQDREKLQADEGTLVAVSPLAFTYENWPEGSRKPQPGDRVVFRKHAGLLRTNKANGRDFRLLNDKDIVAIVETAPEPVRTGLPITKIERPRTPFKVEG